MYIYVYHKLYVTLLSIDQFMDKSTVSVYLHINLSSLLTFGKKYPESCTSFIELDYGKIYRKTLYLVKTMVSCRFSLKPIQ